MESTVYIDPSTARKGQILQNRLQFHDSLPMFSMIELNMLGRCNRRCSFCPVSLPDFYDNIDHRAKFDMELYTKLMLDLKSIGYEGLFMYSGLSEPLLIKNVDDYVACTKTILPNSRVEIITNGDAATVKRLRRLFASGLDTLLVSMYDGPEQIEKFTKLGQDAQLNNEQLVLRRRYYEDGNYGLTVSNRGGLIDSNSFRDEEEAEVVELPLQRSCYYPFYMVKIDYDGDVTICSHDWDKKWVIGNIAEAHIWDIWKSQAMHSVKASLSQSNRNMAPCANCDVHGDVMGKAHFEAWMQWSQT